MALFCYFFYNVCMREVRLGSFVNTPLCCRFTLFYSREAYLRRLISLFFVFLAISADLNLELYDQLNLLKYLLWWPHHWPHIAGMAHRHVPLYRKHQQHNHAHAKACIAKEQFQVYRVECGEEVLPPTRVFLDEHSQGKWNGENDSKQCCCRVS